MQASSLWTSSTRATNYSKSWSKRSKTHRVTRRWSSVRLSNCSWRFRLSMRSQWARKRKVVCRAGTTKFIRQTRLWVALVPLCKTQSTTLLRPTLPSRKDPKWLLASSQAPLLSRLTCMLLLIFPSCPRSLPRTKAAKCSNSPSCAVPNRSRMRTNWTASNISRSVSGPPSSKQRLPWPQREHLRLTSLRRDAWRQRARRSRSRVIRSVESRPRRRLSSSRKRRVRSYWDRQMVGNTPRTHIFSRIRLWTSSE